MKSRRLLSPTLNTLRPLLPAYLSLVVLSLPLPILFFAAPLYAGQVMSRVMTSRSETTLVLLTVISLFLIAVYSAIEWVREQSLQRAGVAIDAKLSGLLFDAMHRPNAASGVMASSGTLNDFNIVRDTLSGRSVTAVIDALWAPLFILAMTAIHWVFGLVAAALMTLTALIAALNYWFADKDVKRSYHLHAKALEFGQAVSRNVDSVRALGMLPRLRDRWATIHQASLGWQSAASAKANIFAALTRFLRNSQMIMIYAIGAVLYLNQEVSAAGIFVAMMIMMRSLLPIDALISNWQNYTRFFTALARVDEVLRAADDRPRRPSLPMLGGAVTVSRVYAAAPGSDRIILNDVSFSVEPGRIVGVVGSSGAGKSCLARVLVGIWAPRRGSVSMGDHDLAHWNEDELGLRVGYMSQDIELLPGTIAENIARFDPDAVEDPSRVLAAVELAGIQDLIKSLPEGLATPVGLGGHVLSGGQRSRVALARAVYGDPMLVVLDEPNSNLDAASEQTLIRATQRLQARGATVFIVTHKLNILNYCDDVLVMNAGSVQAFASRELIVDRLPRLRAQPTLSVVGGEPEAGAA